MRSLLTLALVATAAAPARAQVFDDLILPPTIPTFDYNTHSAVASNGEWAVLGIGSPDHLASLHRWDPSSSRWEVELELIPSTGPFGGLSCAVDIGPDLLVVGDPGSNTAVGAAYAWYRDPATGEWVEAPPVVAPQSGPAEFIGASVLVEGLSAWIGAPRRDVGGAIDAGAVVEYRFDPGTWTWSFEQELTAATPVAGAGFGWDLGKAGSRLVVGAPGDWDTPRGTLSIFRKQAGAWIVDQTLDDPVSGSGGYFGFDVAMDDDLVVTSGSGAIWVLRFDPAAQQYVFEADLAAVTSLVASSLDVEAGTVAVGAPFDGSKGRVGVFRRPACAGGVWTQTHELHTIHEHQGTYVDFGDSVELEGDRLLVGMDEYTFIGGPVTIAATTLVAPEDCDGNGQADVCDIAAGAQDLDADGVLDDCESVGVRYCSPNAANSTGASAWLLAQGSQVVGEDRLVLTMGSLPQDKFGLFLASRESGFVANAGGSQGDLCLGGKLGRIRVPPHQWWSSGLEGRVHAILDLGALPMAPEVPVLPGETWYFQAWYRDKNPTVTSNFTDALAVTFE